METCPCYDACPTCKFGMCSNFCPPSDLEKCEILWEYENNQCIKDCDDTRAQLLDDCKAGCNGESECIDECVLSANTWHSCCFKECPCHTNCQEGCPCSDTEWTCGEPEMPGYCPEGGFQPDPECLYNPDNIAGVQRCVGHCTDISYNCYLECANLEGEDAVDCRYECKVQEAECKNQCPCYEQCPHGCPCSPWCLSEEQICETVWEYENDQCSKDCDNTRSEMFDMCKDGCAGDSACIDTCLGRFLNWCFLLANKIKVDRTSQSELSSKTVIRNCQWLASMLLQELPLPYLLSQRMPLLRCWMGMWRTRNGWILPRRRIPARPRMYRRKYRSCIKMY